MFYSLKKNIQEDPKQQLCINKESDYVQQCQQSEINQNYNYPPSQQNQQQYQQYQQQYQSNQQQYQQQYPTITNPQLQNQQIQEPTSQSMTQVQVGCSKTNDEDAQFQNVGRKRVFAITVVTLWMLQITIEVSIVIKKGIYLLPGLLYPCFFIALLIMLYTLYNNYPINQMKKIRFIDQLLFIIYFLLDIFVIFLFFFIINDDGINYILVITLACQGSNLLCSLFPLFRTQNKINSKEILLLTLIPFGLMILLTTIMNEWIRAGSLIYLIPITQQILQICETFNLVRVINEIYSKQNTKIDIENIYTGFILFKYSYYIPF